MKKLISLLILFSFTTLALGQENETLVDDFKTKYESSYKHYLDTTSLFKEKDTLTSIDSITLKAEFDIVFFEMLMQDLKSEKPFSLDLQDNTSSVRIAYDWDQLESADQKLIKESSQRYLLKLAKKDIKGFWELCHPKFKESTSYVSFQEIGLIIADMFPVIDSIEFIDAKKIVYTRAPETSQFSTGGSIDKSNPTYLQFYTLAGIENQSLSLYKLNVQPLSKIITMKFGLVNSIYKLTSLEINTSAVNNNDANYYYEIANDWISKDSNLPRFVVLNMAYRLSYLGKGTSTSKMLEITEEIQSLQKDNKLIEEIREWNIKDSNYDIISIDFLETQSDITPNISYISKKKLGKRSTIKEVKVLFEYFENKYPYLVEEFKAFIFTAYEEYPALPSKQYPFYRVIMD